MYSAGRKPYLISKFVKHGTGRIAGLRKKGHRMKVIVTNAGNGNRKSHGFPAYDLGPMT